ncbi:MAG: glycosyltransferase, group 2 family protein [Verrucomicrobiaceae bacterium]|nr:glycosyltransferase, group 2 family protein [Verrucomicrobiaceae bacterium]
MKSCTISVLITYFNEKEMLTSCLTTLLQQNPLPDEVLIYDDASTEPPQPYLPAGLTCRVIRGEENRGPAYGRNILLQAATGEYVHFHDSDDWFHPDWWQRVRQVIQETGVPVVFTEIASSRENAPRYDNEVLGLRSLHADPDLVRFCLRGFMLVPSGTYKRELLLSMGGYDAGQWQSEDFDFHVRLAATKPLYETILSPLISIRIRPEGRSNNWLGTWRDALRSCIAMQAVLPEEYHHELANTTAHFAAQLYRTGDKEAAKRGFQAARALSTLTFPNESLLYRVIAMIAGPILAEKAGRWYRLILPPFLRRSVRKLIPLI